MNPPPWPNSKTQVPFEAKGLVKFPELGPADPFLPCPLPFRGQGYSHSGPPWEGLLWGRPSRHQLRLSCPGQSLGMVELPGARRFPAALSQSPPLTPITRLGPQPWGLDTC